MSGSEKAKDGSISQSIQKTEVDESVTPVEDPKPQAITFPDGGFWAWSTAIGAFLVQYACFGYINAFGVYQDFYVREYLSHSTPSDIGWIGGIQICLTFGIGLITGTLFDRGYFRYLMVATIVLNALGVFMLSLARENQYYQVFLTNGLCLGLATGITYVPSLGIVSHYFQKRRALVIGIVSSGSALGAVLHPIMLNHLFDGPIGFHNGVRISAALNTVLLLIAFAMMRTRLPPKHSSAHFGIKEWFKQPDYSLMVVSAVFTFLGLFFPVFYLQLYAIKHGVNETDAFYAISVINAASFFGRLVPSTFAHKAGLANSFSISLIATGIVTLTMIAVKDLAGVYVFAIFWGFCSGSCIALAPATVGSMANDASEVGVRLSLFFGLGSVAGLFATPISGALLTADYRWLSPVLFSGITMIVSGLIAGASRMFLAKKKGKQYV